MQGFCQPPGDPFRRHFCAQPELVLLQGSGALRWAGRAVLEAVFRAAGRGVANVAKRIDPCSWALFVALGYFADAFTFVSDGM